MTKARKKGLRFGDTIRGSSWISKRGKIKEITGNHIYGFDRAIKNPKLRIKNVKL